MGFNTATPRLFHTRSLAIRVCARHNVQFYLRTRRALVASAWLSLSRRRAVTSGRAHKHRRSFNRSHEGDRHRARFCMHICNDFWESARYAAASMHLAERSPPRNCDGKIRWRSAVIHVQSWDMNSRTREHFQKSLMASDFRIQDVNRW